MYMCACVTNSYDVPERFLSEHRRSYYNFFLDFVGCNNKYNRPARNLGIVVHLRLHIRPNHIRVYPVELPGRKWSRSIGLVD